MYFMTKLVHFHEADIIMCIRDKASKLLFVLLTRAAKEKGIKFGTTYSEQMLRCRSFQITLGHPLGVQKGSLAVRISSLSSRRKRGA